MPDPQDDFDSPWKNALTRYFPEFMAFFFPAAHAAIDWAQDYVFLEQELAQITRGASLGKRVADKLVQVAVHGGERQWVYIHIEIQGKRERQFAHRVFTYNYRIHDRYSRPVASLVLLADRSRTWRPTDYSYSLLGCTMRLNFPVVKLSDFAPTLKHLLLSENVFALVTAAHLLTRQTRGEPALRAAAKWRLALLLMRRDWDRRRIIDLLVVIDWMMYLPEHLERPILHSIHVWEQEAEMRRYVTSWERIGRADGRKMGIEEGRREGRREGVHAGQSGLLLQLLTLRFGELPAPLQERVGQADSRTLLAWGSRLLHARTLQEVFDGG